MTMDTFTILTVAVLHDEFGFGEKRCQRFIDRMNKKAECMIMISAPGMMISEQ